MKRKDWRQNKPKPKEEKPALKHKDNAPVTKILIDGKVVGTVTNVNWSINTR